MGAFCDLTGNKYGRLTVLYRTKNKGKRVQWHCQCDCGNECDVVAEHLKNGHTKSCGCYQKDQTAKATTKNLINQKFGKLTVVSKSNERRNGIVMWNCICDCGCQTLVRSADLLSGHTQSCGCIQSKGEEIIAQILQKHHITFERQKIFKDCIFPDSGYYAYFDFYLPDFNMIIEYDGIQHFIARDDNGWNTTENLIKTKKHDLIKDNYCKDNNIKLIRISYLESPNKILKELIRYED